jgi:hypothetical protein
MRLEKLKIDAFEKNSLSFSALKSLVGGSKYTGDGSGGITDFIDDKGGTHFRNCGSCDDAPCQV